tara:strand:- start:1064 stop:1246 length:183 start_codon:yes stop_codon:yes gene_type:complete
MTFIDATKIFFIVAIIGWMLDRRFRTIDISGARRTLGPKWLQPNFGRSKPKKSHDDLERK